MGVELWDWLFWSQDYSPVVESFLILHISASPPPTQNPWHLQPYCYIQHSDASFLFFLFSCQFFIPHNHRLITAHHDFVQHPLEALSPRSGNSQTTRPGGRRGTFPPRTSLHQRQLTLHSPFRPYPLFTGTQAACQAPTPQNASRRKTRPKATYDVSKGNTCRSPCSNGRGHER